MSNLGFCGTLHPTLGRPLKRIEVKYYLLQQITVRYLYKTNSVYNP